MASGTGDRDPDKVRGRQAPVNFRLQGVENGWILLVDDPSIGRISHIQRNRVQSFLDVAVYRTSFLRIRWSGFSAPGREDRIEVRAARRIAESSNPVIAHYLSAPWSGNAQGFDEMIVPFSASAPDGFPVGSWIRGTIQTISNFADPGAWAIDSVLLCGGTPPPTTATVIP